MKILGIDEAGRGPVIGPMVMTGVMISSYQEDELKRIGVKDSKLIAPNLRRVMAHKLENYDYETVSLSPKEIDQAVLGPTMNLNLLEAQASALIIAKLKPDQAILDCPSTNPPDYIRAVKGFLPSNVRVEIIAEHKADAKYPVVSAASIIAKVTRDAEIELLKSEIGVNFGSGYPSDPLTKEFLKANWHKYDFFRKSWSTWRVLADSKNQSSLADFKV